MPHTHSEQPPDSFDGAQVLSASQVRAVARLARLDLADAQVEQCRAQLSSILGYMDRLRALDLSAVEPMSHPNDAANRLAADEPGPTLPNAALMSLAPDAMEPFVKVPKVIGEGSA